MHFLIWIVYPKSLKMGLIFFSENYLEELAVLFVFHLPQSLTLATVYTLMSNIICIRMIAVTERLLCQLSGCSFIAS